MDLGFDKPLEIPPGTCLSWVLERLTKGGPWV